MSIEIVSLNVRVLRVVLKRRSIFNYYRDRGNIICLQETHSSPKDEAVWKSEWNGDILFSHGETNFKGVCVLLVKGMSKNVSTIQTDIEGRILNFNLQVEEYNLTICSISAPNVDSPEFFNKNI